MYLVINITGLLNSTFLRRPLWYKMKRASKKQVVVVFLLLLTKDLSLNAYIRYCFTGKQPLSIKKMPAFCQFVAGDLGYYDSDGYVYVIDRISLMIKYDSHLVSNLYNYINIEFWQFCNTRQKNPIHTIFNDSLIRNSSKPSHLNHLQ